MALLALTLSLACTHAKSYSLEGKVIRKNQATGELVIDHGDIPGFMTAMTMPYKLKDPSSLGSVEVGDRITAKITIDPATSDYWLEDVKVTDRSGRSAKAGETSREVSPGDRVLDIPLTNQDGHTIRLSDLRGKAVLLTFIYTRCPMPNFCPRLSSAFARIEKELKKNPDEYQKTHLLSISFDPKYDSPAVLRKYGLGYLEGDAAGFSHWEFAGTKPEDLRVLAQTFGLDYEEQDNQIAHTMNIALIAPDGMIAKTWSSEWTQDELLAALRSAAQR